MTDSTNLAVLAGTASTALFVASTLPMLAKGVYYLIVPVGYEWLRHRRNGRPKPMPGRRTKADPPISCTRSGS